jgi:hypothetical protein
MFLCYNLVLHNEVIEESTLSSSTLLIKNTRQGVICNIRTSDLKAIYKILASAASHRHSPSTI